MRSELALAALFSFATLVGSLAGPAAAFVPPVVKGKLEHRGDSVFVPGATYKMGAEAKWPGGQSYGNPPGGISVTVKSFLIDRTEVTAGSYRACVSAGQCDALTHGDTFSPNHTKICTYDKPGFEQHPINCVSWDEAVKYCGWVGKRLPTEAEWELTARGTDSRAFPWGDVAPTAKHMNGCDIACQREAMAQLGETYTSMWPDPATGDDGWGFTAPVGFYPLGASPYGALEMSGNVEEWVSDSWWDPYSNPSGPPTPVSGSTDHVVRGGAWDLNGMETFSTTRRTSASSTQRAAWLGFRCAKDS
ncbi:MAG: SUMF1/EgtB/PvdO family nonheme iron enzyme [Myxococcales bacterium]|nr:SUMF1/EgtB/PvdO family nonheme iron enzyme [Myxococcales bacterium]